MNEQQQQASQYAYQTDPTYHAIISEMVAQAVPPNKGRIHNEVALHLFVYGTAMVLSPSLTDRPLARPWDWGIRHDGTAEFLGTIPETYEGPEPEPLPSEHFCLLTMEEGLPAPSLKDGEVVGAEPWLAAWATAMKDLDAFLDASQ